MSDKEEPVQETSETQVETQEETQPQQDSPKKNQRQRGNRRDGGGRRYWKKDLKRAIYDDPEWKMLEKPEDLKKPQKSDLTNNINSIKDEIKNLMNKFESLKRARTNWRKNKNFMERESKEKDSKDNAALDKVYKQKNLITKKMRESEEFVEKQELDGLIKGHQNKINSYKTSGALKNMRTRAILDRVDELEYTLANSNMTATEEKKIKKELDFLKLSQKDCHKILELQEEMGEWKDKREKLRKKLNKYYDAQDVLNGQLRQILGEDEYEKKHGKGRKEYLKERDRLRKEREEEKKRRQMKNKSGQMEEDGGFGNNRRGRRSKDEPRVYEEGDVFSPQIDSLFDKRSELRDKIKQTYRNFDKSVEDYRNNLFHKEQYEFALEIVKEKEKREEEQKGRLEEMRKKIKSSYKEQLEKAKEMKFQYEIEDCDYLLTTLRAMDPENKSKEIKLVKNVDGDKAKDANTELSGEL